MLGLNGKFILRCCSHSMLPGGGFDGMIRVLESIKTGKRLPEAQFSNLSIAPKNQKSVYGMFNKVNSRSDSEVLPNGAV